VIKTVRWHPKKADENWQKHGIRFEEAKSVFYDPLLASIDDEEHSEEEYRFFLIGESTSSQVLSISYTIRDDDAWLISARRSTPAERRRYMRGDRIRDRGRDEEEPINLEDFPEVDFTNAVRGRHYIPKWGVAVVQIAPDVAEYFDDDESVNAALRTLIAEGRAPKRAEGIMRH